MKKANTYFLLSGVNDHVNVHVQNSVGGVCLYIFSDGVTANMLQIRLKRVGKGFTLSYVSMIEGYQVMQPESGLISGLKICRVLSDIVNDVFPKG